MTNKCCHKASGEQRWNDSCLIQSLTSWQPLLVMSQLIALPWQVWYHHGWAGSCCMSQSRGTCWCSRKELPSAQNTSAIICSWGGEREIRGWFNVASLIFEARAGGLLHIPSWALQSLLFSSSLNSSLMPRLSSSPCREMALLRG